MEVSNYWIVVEEESYSSAAIDFTRINLTLLQEAAA